MIDGADILLMQNWEHLDFIFHHLNRIPKNSKRTDFSRLKDYYLYGWSKHTRQNLIFTSILTPEINSLWNHSCQTVFGNIKTRPSIMDGSIIRVVPKIKQVLQSKLVLFDCKQVFRKLNCSSIEQLDDFRFNHFVTEVLYWIG